MFYCTMSKKIIFQPVKIAYCQLINIQINARDHTCSFYCSLGEHSATCSCDCSLSGRLTGLSPTHSRRTVHSIYCIDRLTLFSNRKGSRILIINNKVKSLIIRADRWFFNQYRKLWYIISSFLNTNKNKTFGEKKSSFLSLSRSIE